MDPSKLLFHPSALGKIAVKGNELTELQKVKLDEFYRKTSLTAAQEKEMTRLIAKKEDLDLSDTVKVHLADLYVANEWGRGEEVNNKFLTKGNAREEDSITLFARVTKKMFIKNTERVENDWLTGEYDLKVEDMVTHVILETVDIKSSWSANTFFRAKVKGLLHDYKWQGIGYMCLTGAMRHLVAFCLVNGLGQAIADEKRLLTFRSGMMDRHGNPTEKYLELARKIERNHIFDLEEFLSEPENVGFDFESNIKQWKYDIPYQKRCHGFYVNRNEDDIDFIKRRIDACRKWIEKTFYAEGMDQILLAS